jgi:hypothetical protein
MDHPKPVSYHRTKVRPWKHSLFSAIGDVAGKGVAAAMLMSHLSAMLRTLITVGLPLSDLMERASRVFCESTLPMHYATLVCGRASSSGEIEVCNAGHPPPLLVRADEIERLDATGLPIGMFCSERFVGSALLRTFLRRAEPSRPMSAAVWHAAAFVQAPPAACRVRRRRVWSETSRTNAHRPGRPILQSAGREPSSSVATIGPCPAR